MSIIDRFTSTRDLLTETTNDDQQQNSDRVLNPETRRALGRELRATRRLWGVVLAFVPFVYASAFLWTLGLSVQLFAVLLALDMLAGIGVSMYVAVRLNLLLRPRGESQSFAGSDAATDSESDAAEPEPEAETEVEAVPEDGESAPEESEQPDQPDQQEPDDHEPPDTEAQPDSELADGQAETQNTDDATDMTSERIIS